MMTRFLNKIKKTKTCWLWQGACTTGRGGYKYGSFHYEGKTVRAHRFSYEKYVGPIPKGLTIDHLCGNRKCVNPTHLEAVTIRENILRGTGTSVKNAKKTHCPYGHAYDEKNTKIRPNGARRCKECHRTYIRNYLRKKRLNLKIKNHVRV